jgi:hypothetical protein
MSGCCDYWSFPPSERRASCRLHLVRALCAVRSGIVDRHAWSQKGYDYSYVIFHHGILLSSAWKFYMTHITFRVSRLEGADM